jgi:hypothetical protein
MFIGMVEPDLNQLSGRVAAVADRLRIDAATAEVLSHLEACGVGALLLKGPSFAAWLYRDGERLVYKDVDLLIGPGDMDVVAKVLAELRYRQRVEQEALPGWWLGHASEWWRAADGVQVDVHRTLPGIGVDPRAAWLALSAETEELPVAGRSARTLTVPARALHVALHAAHHGAGGGKPLEDLERALEIADDELWRRATALADELDATDAFAAGLRLKAAGVAVAARLALPAGRSVEVALRAASAPAEALGFERLARARTWRERADIVGHKLVPPPEFMRHWSPAAAGSRRMLLRAYLQRPFWILRRAPRALSAWYETRRRVHRK